MNHSITKLKVSSDGHYLLYADDMPFFYLADTAWELFHKLDREEADGYLEDRAKKGFTVIQASLLAEMDGLRRSNAYSRSPMKINDSGRYDPSLPDTDGEYSYWDHVDWIIRRAAELKMYVAVSPAWGDKFIGMDGEGPHMFTSENSYAYGEWIGSRYADFENIIWIMGGNRNFCSREQLGALDAMARGIKAGDGGAHLMTMLPARGQHSSVCVHDEKWLDFNMVASGQTRSRFNYEMIKRDYRKFDYKPVLDGAPVYEGCPEGGMRADIPSGYLDAADARRSAWWAVLSGACGHAYGHHSVQNFVTLPDKDTPKGYYCTDWRSALGHEGAGEMRHLRTVMEKVPFHKGRPAADMVCGNLKGVNFVPVLKGTNWLIAYSAQGLMVELELDDSWKGAQAYWINPRSGEWSDGCSILKTGIVPFEPMSAGRSADWVLLIQKMMDQK